MTRVARARTAIDHLIHAAGGCDEDLAATIDGIGVPETAALVVGEILIRCDPPVSTDAVQIQVDFSHGRRSVPYTFRLASSAASADPGQSPAAVAWIGYDLPCLVRALYGAARKDQGFRVEVHWPPPEDLGAIFASIGAITLAIESVLTACRSAAASLDHLAARFGSDKWGSLHWYTPHYERHFAPLREQPIRLLEIGIGGYRDPHSGGGSLRMWQRYFSRGMIYGLDVFPKTGVQGPRIRTIQGDQGDADFLAGLGAESGPFDIIIDDGSHINDHVLISLKALFPHVRDSGLYVIEDIQTSYWPGFGGTADEVGDPVTTTAFLKTMLDGLHHQEYDHPEGYEPSYFDRHIVGMHIYHNIAVIEKGANSEQGAPPWIPRGPLG